MLGFFFPAAKQQPERRVPPLGADGSVGTWVWDIPPGRRMCTWGTDGPRQGQPLSGLSGQSLSPRQDGPRWGPGPGDGDGAGAGPACSGPGGGAVSWARERAAGKAGHDGEVRGVGEPREDAPSPPGSARSARGTSSQFTLCRGNTETQTSGSQHDRRLSFALSGPSEGLPSRAPPAGTRGPGSTGCGELAPAPTASDRK